MKHNYTLTGRNYKIRPVTDQDAAFIVELRNNPLKSKFINKGAQNISEQHTWLSNYYTREGDYYFVVENKATKKNEGLISLYELDTKNLTAEWGRWVIAKGSLAALESVFLIYQFAFEILNLSEIYSRTVCDNTKSVSFHDDCGVKRKRIIKSYYFADGRAYDAIEHALSQKESI